LTAEQLAGVEAVGMDKRLLRRRFGQDLRCCFEKKY